MASSDQYREGQDYLTEFAKEKIYKKEGGRIKKEEVLEEFKKWHVVHYGNGSKPKGREIYDFMDKRYGPCRKKGGMIKQAGWQNVAIIGYDDDEDEMYNC